MGGKKVVVMILKVDLQCSRCCKKVKKILCKFPQIRDQVFNEKANTVTIRVCCCDPEGIRDKLCCKGGGTIKSIEIIEPGGGAESKKPVADNPKPPEPVAVPEPKPKPKPKPKPQEPAPKPQEEVVVIVPQPAPVPPAPEPKPEASKPALEPIEPPLLPPYYDYGRPGCYGGCGGMCPCCCTHRCEYIVIEETSVCIIM